MRIEHSLFLLMITAFEAVNTSKIFQYHIFGMEGICVIFMSSLIGYKIKTEVQF